MISIIFLANIVLTLFLYLYLYRIRNLINFPFRMNISMIVGGIFPLISGILLIEQYPLYFTEVTMLTAVLGMVSGGMIGYMFDAQSFLTGFTNGFMTGIMAPMFGSLITVQSSILYFIEFLFLFSYLLVMLTSRRSEGKEI